MLLLFLVWLLDTRAVTFLSLTNIQSPNSLFLSSVTVQNGEMNISHIADLSNLGTYLSATYNGTHVSMIFLANNDHTYFVYVISSDGYISPYYFKSKNDPIVRIEADGPQLFATSASWKTYHDILVQIKMKNGQSMTQLHDWGWRYTDSGSCYDRSKHIYWLGYTNDTLPDFYSYIIGIDTQTLNITGPYGPIMGANYGIMQIITGSNGSIIGILHNYENGHNYLFLMPIPSDKTTIALEYAESHSIITSALDEKDKKLYSIAEDDKNQEYYLLVTDLITLNYNSTKISGYDIPLAMWMI
jgi:hypothetical protein